jgi:hypothetical protein
MKYLVEYLDDNEGDCACCREKRTVLNILDITDLDYGDGPDSAAIEEANSELPDGNYTFNLYKLEKVMVLR